jgi:hypothetical protein
MKARRKRNRLNKEKKRSVEFDEKKKEVDHETSRGDALSKTRSAVESPVRAVVLYAGYRFWKLV